MDSNHDIVPTLRMFDGLIMNKAADEIERLRGLLAAPASPIGEDADEQSAAPMAETVEATGDAVDVAIALEQQRALSIVKAVRELHFGTSDRNMPTQASAAFDLACEEIETRLRTERKSTNLSTSKRGQ